MKKRLWALLLLLVLVTPFLCPAQAGEKIVFASLPRAFIDWDIEVRDTFYTPVVYHYTGGDLLEPLLRLEQDLYVMTLREDTLWYIPMWSGLEDESFPLFCADLQSGETKLRSELRLQPTGSVWATEQGLFLTGRSMNDGQTRGEIGLYALDGAELRLLASGLRDSIWGEDGFCYLQGDTVYRLDPVSGESRRLCTLDEGDFPYLPPRLMACEDGVLSVIGSRCILRFSAETGEELGRLDTTGSYVGAYHEGWYYGTRRAVPESEERKRELFRVNAAGQEEVYGCFPLSGSWDLSERVVFGKEGFLFLADPILFPYADGADGYWYFPYDGSAPVRLTAAPGLLSQAEN